MQLATLRTRAAHCAQLETDTPCGALNAEARSGWETGLFNGAYRDGPGAQPARNAAHDEFASLYLLRHNTGLGTQRALFELHHCDIPPEERAELIGKIRREVEAETAKKKAAQEGDVAQRAQQRPAASVRVRVLRRAQQGGHGQVHQGPAERAALQMGVSRALTVAACREMGPATLRA